MNKMQYLYAVLIACTLSACTKEEVPPQETAKNTLNDVVRDNFGLTYLATALYRSGLDKTLMQPGSVTLIAPSDDAYKASGYYTPAALYGEPVNTLAQQGQYHILKSAVTFTGKELAMNKEEETALGTNVYWSRVLRGKDTLTTVNGARILKSDTKASNGIMQVLDRVLRPNIHATLKDALAADVELSLFYEALKVSGLLESLAGTANFTVFAPNNGAVKNYGYANLDAIKEADPLILREWLSYHMAKERKFAQDYFLLTPEGMTTYTEEMSNGKTINITLNSQYNVPNSFTGITVAGPNNTGWGGIAPSRTDIVTGNGVIHIIGEMLK